MNNTNKKILVPINQVAKVLDVSVTTIRRWHKAKVVPWEPERGGGGTRLYSLDQIEELKIMIEMKRKGRTAET